MVLPSFYLGDLARKRQRSAELSAGLDKANATGIGGLSSLAALQEKLKGDALAADERSYKRGRDTKEDERTAKEDARKEAEEARKAADETFKVQNRAGTLALLRERIAAASAKDKAKAEKDSKPKEPKALAPDAQVRMDEAILKGARSTLDSVAATAVEKGTPLDDVLKSARDDDRLGPITGDEEVEAAYQAAKTKALADKQAAALRDKDLNKPTGNGVETEMQRLRREKLELEIAEAKKKAEGGAKPTVTEALGLTEINVALDEAKRLAKDKGKIDTGPLANARNFFAQKVGLDDGNITAYKASIGEQLAQYVKSISGATVSENERASLLQNIPTMSDNDVAFSAKLDRVIKMLNDKRAAHERALKAAGKDTSGLQPTSAPAETIRVRRKDDGRTGKIPANKFDPALHERL